MLSPLTFNMKLSLPLIKLLEKAKVSSIFSTAKIGEPAATSPTKAIVLISFAITLVSSSTDTNVIARGLEGSFIINPSFSSSAKYR